LKPKDASKDNLEFAEAEITLVQNILFTLEENAIHQTLSLRILARCPTLIDLDLPLTILINIIGREEEASHLHTGDNKSKA
jgi:hypothetical protein